MSSQKQQGTPAFWCDLLLLGALLVSSGCSSGERVDQCNALAQRVNQALAPVKEHLAAHPELARGTAPSEDYADLATRYSAVAKSAEATELEDSRIIELRDDYAKLFAETSDACNDLKAARSNDDASAQRRALREFTRLKNREDSLLRQAKALCEPR